MKKTVFLFLSICILLSFVQTEGLKAQAPEKISYQAVVRDASNALLANQNIGMQISILQGSVGGAVVYIEYINTVTNANGLLTVEIGDSLGFDTIEWANGPYFIKTEIDPSGGTTYTISGTTQLLSVPYALHAKTADNGIDRISANGDTLFLVNGQYFCLPDSSGGGIEVPSVTTDTLKNITSNGADFGGSASCSSPIMERGFVYSTTPNPTTSSNKILCGLGSGSFDTSVVASYNYAHILESNTTYYVRAYAITENNIVAYGSQQSFTTLVTGQAGPSGGIVFYDKGNSNGGWRYLEAAATDQSAGVIWGCNGTYLSGTVDSIGAGANNTLIIVTGCTAGTYAAHICNDLVLGGYSDWYLPCRTELYLMYFNLYRNGLGSFAADYYWSSTEASSINAYYLRLHTGASSYYGKTVSDLVRAIRAY